MPLKIIQHVEAPELMDMLKELVHRFHETYHLIGIHLGENVV